MQTILDNRSLNNEERLLFAREIRTQKLIGEIVFFVVIPVVISIFIIIFSNLDKIKMLVN